MKLVLISMQAVLLAALFCFTGCNPDKPANPIITILRCEYYYDATTDSTAVGAEVIIRKLHAETLLDTDVNILPVNDFMTFNNDTLQYNPAGNGSYEVRYHGFVPNGTFLYHAGNVNTYSFDMPTVSTRSLPQTFTAINRHNIDTLFWLGPALTADEGSMDITLTDTASGYSRPYHSFGATNFIVLDTFGGFPSGVTSAKVRLDYNYIGPDITRGNYYMMFSQNCRSPYKTVAVH